MDEGTASPAAAGQASAHDIAGMSFEAALAALEQIVQALERGDVPLDQSISLYERGEALRAACQQRLDAAQARIERIVTASDGRATGTQPFDTEG
ncbi:MAG: exodeoxyribonuclease VII small subunit [Sphingomonadales bacterium]|nr:exodeoxyribonuclease VII small subunit [Sphingomonadales bacterium]NCQ21430.1 exodeoxyribonuclease VII small subunit [Sphingomonadales bacterium]NCT04217.1 exodeoxyribonuclease VII small subunit [Sphingomonadales bacterium]